MDKEDFIVEILNSVDDISKATLNPAVFLRIKERIEEPKVSLGTVWLVAASIVILIALNALIVTSKPNSDRNEIATLEKTLNKSNQLY